MANLYRRRRSSNWWFRICKDNKILRETTGEKDKDRALLVMERRVREMNGELEVKLPKILLLDIETAPIEAYCWTFWPNFIDPMSQIVKNSKGNPNLIALPGLPGHEAATERQRA